MRIALDTSCIVNLLSPDEQPDPGLLRLLRHALSGRLPLSVTPLVDAELPKLGEERADRGFMRQSLAQFPTTQISSARVEERDGLAREWFALLWPNADPTSRKSRHGLRDCLHLASHRLCGGDVFVTLDEKLSAKAAPHRRLLGLEVIPPEEAAARADTAAEPFASSRTPVVRRAQDDDKGEIRELLRPILHIEAPMTITAVDYDRYEQILEAGGVSW